MVSSSEEFRVQDLLAKGPNDLSVGLARLPKPSLALSQRSLIPRLTTASRPSTTLAKQLSSSEADIRFESDRNAAPRRL